MTIKKKYTFKMITAIILLGFTSLIFIPWKSIVESEIKNQLELKNFKVHSLQVTELNSNGIIIENLNVNDGAIAFKKLQVKTTLDSLMKKSIGSIQLDGLQLEKEKLISSFKSDKSSQKNHKNENLQETIQSIPIDNIDFSLSSLDGLHPDMKSGEFPTHIKFNRSRNELRISIKGGHVKEFKTLKDIYVDTELILNVFKNHIELNLQHLIINLPGKIIKLDPNTKINMDLDKNNNLTLDKLDMKFNLSLDITDQQQYLTKLQSQNDISLKGGRYLLETKIIHPEKTAELIIKGWLDSKNTNIGVFDVDLEIKNLTEKKLFKTSPALAKHVKKIDGSLSLNGMIKMTEKEIIPELKIEGKEINFQYEESKVKGLAFTHHLSNIKTYGSKNENYFFIEELDVGLIIKNLKTKYKVFNKNNIKINSFSLSTFDGLVFAEDFSLQNNKPKNLVIRLKKFPLSKLLNLALKDGVLATGDIEGELPIIFVKNNGIIKNGRLKNSSKGIIKYRPGRANPLKSMNQMQVNILLNYLKDFSYDKLLIDAHSDEEYNLILNSKLQGSNPDVYKGRPLKLGVNLNFNVKDAIISKMMFMKIPEKIEERLIREMEK
ncbi:MAG: hypothetical protein HN576_14930 [Bacteriovoracaceae bacterium]|jgi:hypothetical protein|nr:hypothetical protein [Bacteriovoracaceae bacterium]